MIVKNQKHLNEMEYKEFIVSLTEIPEAMKLWFPVMTHGS